MPEQKRVSIVHGDYRLDNMIFHATEPRVQAVLDWELSTLGDPMADFTYLLMQWTMPGLDNADLKALNIPSMEEAAKIYCDVTGTAVPDLNWYFSYNLFRLAGITQGIAGRIRDGTAANAKAMESPSAPCRCQRRPGNTRRRPARRESAGNCCTPGNARHRPVGMGHPAACYDDEVSLLRENLESPIGCDLGGAIVRESRFRSVS